MASCARSRLGDYSRELTGGAVGSLGRGASAAGAVAAPPMSFQQLNPTFDAACSSSSSAPLPLSQPPVALPPAQKWVIFFHLLFKSVAVILYMLSDSFLHNYVLTFVLVRASCAPPRKSCARRMIARRAPTRARTSEPRQRHVPGLSLCL